MILLCSPDHESYNVPLVDISAASRRPLAVTTTFAVHADGATRRDRTAGEQARNFNGASPTRVRGFRNDEDGVKQLFRNAQRITQLRRHTDAESFLSTGGVTGR
jgi:hypothetical protein